MYALFNMNKLGHYVSNSELKSCKLYNNKLYFSSFERLILSMSSFIILCGISQDNAGSLIWWVFISAGFGVLLRHKYKSPTSLITTKALIQNKKFPQTFLAIE